MAVRTETTLSEFAPYSRSFAGLAMRTARFYLLAFALASVCYGVLWRDAPVLGADSPGYLEVAQDMSDFKIEQLHDRSPGYPLLLLVTGASHGPTRALFFISLLLHFASVWLLGATLSLCGLTERTLKLFALLLLLPPYSEAAAYVLTENLASFTLVVSVVALLFSLRNNNTLWAVIAGLAVGYSALTRPTYQALALVFTASLWIIQRLSRWPRFNLKALVKVSAILIVTSAMMIGGYSLMNYLKFDYFGVTPLLGFNLSTKTVPFVERLPDQYAPVRETLIRARDKDLVERGSSHTAYQSVWAAKEELARVTGMSKPRLAKYMQHLNLMLIREAPMQYLQEVMRSISRYWFPSSTKLANMNSLVLQAIWMLLHLVLLSLFGLQLIVLAGTGIHSVAARVVGGRQAAGSSSTPTTLQIAAYTLAFVVVIYTMLISCAVDVGDTRQRVPADALFIFTLFLGLHIWWRAMRPSEHGSKRAFYPAEFNPDLALERNELVQST